LKVSEAKVPIVVIACKVFQDLIERYLPEEFAGQIRFLDYGLHRVPQKLTLAIQEVLDEIQEPSLIVLGYGLCGNGLDGLRARKHTLLVARADDCIAILLGSYQAYMEEFEAEPGTYYLTKGWLESGSNPLKEYREYVERYGEKDAEWLVDTQYQHYKRLVMVAHSQDVLDHYRDQAQQVAEFCQRWDMRYEEKIGSDRYFRRLIEVAEDLSKADGDFVIVQPGETLEQKHFIR
jgi:hypothetical protein